MKTLLFLLVSFIALTAAISGLYMMSNPDSGAMNLPLNLLEGTPFKNYIVPGLLLAVIVGGVNFLAAFLNMQRDPNRYNWAMAGGFMICGWIIIQMILVNSFSWLQIFYLVIGLLIILIAYQLKGKWAV
jgi:FtsH-binding integral membrane protein